MFCEVKCPLVSVHDPWTSGTYSPPVPIVNIRRFSVQNPTALPVYGLIILCGPLSGPFSLSATWSDIVQKHQVEASSEMPKSQASFIIFAGRLGEPSTQCIYIYQLAESFLKNNMLTQAISSTFTVYVPVPIGYVHVSMNAAEHPQWYCV